METSKLKEQLNRIEQLTLLGAKNVLTTEDAVLLTGMSKSHLYKLTCGQKIPHYKPNGKQIYFDRSELESWLKQNRVQTLDEVEGEAISHLLNLRNKKGGKK